MTHKKHWKALPILFALILAVACSKAPNAASSDSDQQVPFNQTDQNQSTAEGNQGPASETKESKLVPATLVIPAGTAINVRLQSSISSGTAQAGQTFDATLDEPIVVDGKTVVPRGAEATGRVVEANPGGRLHKPGYLKVTLASVAINGKNVSVQTSSIAVQGSSHKKRNLLLIGGGAGGGALLGGLLGGPKGALIGAGAGAGAGTAGAYATGKKEVGFVAERRLTFRLSHSLTQPAS